MFDEYSWKKESDEEKRIEILQRKLIDNEIQEEDISDEDIEKILMLFHKQNEYLRERLKMYKQQMSRILKR